MKKYYLVKITVRSGDLEATQCRTIEVDSDKKIDPIADEMAKTFYGDGSTEVNFGYSWNGGETITYVESTHEIDKTVYVCINKYVG